MMKVVVIQRRLTHYRTRMFEMLRERLRRDGAELHLLVGRAKMSEEDKRDAGRLSWAVEVPTKYFFGGRICWQDVLSRVQDADLVVLPQENGLIANYPIIFCCRPSVVAFWGHGANFQSANRRSLRERFKKWMIGNVDWWFAYTRISSNAVLQAGFPDERITTLNNAVDTEELRGLREDLHGEEIQRFRAQTGISRGPVGIFVGSLYAEKRLNWVLDAADALRVRFPEFKLVIVGDGPDRRELDAAAELRPWLHVVGPKFGREKVLYLAAADIVLNPGLVGLGVLDSLACGVPMVTTDCGIHSPEIAYVEHGVNGVIANNCLASFVEGCCSLLEDPVLHSRMRENCFKSSRNYSLQNMVENFAAGIAAALAQSGTKH